MEAFTRGGHFYRYESMHHTEIARRFDKQHFGITTSGHHEHTIYLLCLMVLSLPKCRCGQPISDHCFQRTWKLMSLSDVQATPCSAYNTSPQAPEVRHGEGARGLPRKHDTDVHEVRNVQGRKEIGKIVGHDAFRLGTRNEDLPGN